MAYAGSGTSMTASTTVITHQNHAALELTLINGSGATLYQGQEVNIKASTNYTVELRDAGTDFPVGVVISNAVVDGDRVAVKVPFVQVLKVHAKGGTINAGAFVKPNGTRNADGLMEVVGTTTTGDYVDMVVIKGGAVDTILEVGQLAAPFKY
jgi:hypothetical protein